jgi:hypothetical protein
MTTTTEEAPAENEDLPTTFYDEPDGALAMLVGLVNDDIMTGIGVTLAVPGGIVGGLLISYSAWMDANAEIAEAISPFFTALKDHMNAAKPATDLPPRPIHFIHLCDARYWTPGSTISLPSPGGMLWRGRLAQVSGWSLGTFGASES